MNYRSLVATIRSKSLSKHSIPQNGKKCKKTNMHHIKSLPTLKRQKNIVQDENSLSMSVVKRWRREENQDYVHKSLRFKWRYESGW